MVDYKILQTIVILYKQILQTCHSLTTRNPNNQWALGRVCAFRNVEIFIDFNKVFALRVPAAPLEVDKKLICNKNKRLPTKTNQPNQSKQETNHPKETNQRNQPKNKKHRSSTTKISTNPNENSPCFVGPLVAPPRHLHSYVLS